LFLEYRDSNEFFFWPANEMMNIDRENISKIAADMSIAFVYQKNELLSFNINNLFGI